MSDYTDTFGVLQKMLKKYPKECHQAIVETFAETLSDDWSDKDAELFFSNGLGVSDEANAQIKHEASCWGFNL